MYRKFKADYLFTGTEILLGNTVLITTEDGIITEIVEEQNAGDNIEIFSGLITPGFINAHCHLELSHMKDTIPAKTGLVEFVQQVMRKRFGNDELKQQAMLDAAAEMYNSGIVAVGDICNTVDSMSIKQKSKIHWHNFIEVTGFVDAAAEKRLADAEKLFEDFTSHYSRFTSLSPHAPYSVSKTLFQLLNKKTAGQLITIHNQECAAEDELYKTRSGDFLDLYNNFGIDISEFQSTRKSSLQSWIPYFNNKQSIIAVHNTFISQQDIGFAQSAISDLHFAICPNANLYIEQKLPPIDLLRATNCNIIIGTDSYASNWQLNILEEIKTIQQNVDDIPLQEILQWATINGAKALQMEDKLGNFTKGKQPGVVLIDEIDNLNVTNNSSAKRLL
ncbi:amidohydrolase family protein [Ferruginibacter albus]|uniref:amidohydrolase family protein n=1 Tax=Ferruginibacter albus TaxID=2875540 RepID=UPI001CC58FD4|nr:amidohydrolase family protein [Ferruginibacter albus]UAY51915.1 amidohydrolase family protein [Ferruginibacter albus]